MHQRCETHRGRAEEKSRMSTYFEHFARKGNREEVSLDVIEFEPQHQGIEVSERRFESTGEYLAFIAREMRRGP
jgi:hypothetical protein